MSAVVALTNETALACLEKAAELEFKSEYELALKALQPFWFDIRKNPVISSLDRQIAGLMLLRCGSVLSALCHNYQIPEQERAQNFLTQALDIFSRNDDFERIAQVCNALAWNCKLQGKLAEAKIYLEISLEQPINHHSLWRIQAHYYLAAIYIHSNEYSKAFNVLKNIEHVIAKCEDFHTLARFHNQFALVQMKLGDTDQALRHFELSGHYLEITGNTKNQGLVENNLAWLYLEKKDYESAHKHANEALKIYRKANNTGSEGDTLETKAQLYLAEGNFNEALTVIDDALDLLFKADSYGDLLKSYLTKCRILTALGRTDDALAVFAAAHELATSKISEEKAAEVRALFKQYFSDTLKKNDPEGTSIQKAESPSKDSFKVVLPIGVVPSANHVVLTLENDNFARFNIPESSLLLVERCASVPDNAFTVLLDNEDIFHVGFIVYDNVLQIFALSFCGAAEPIPLDYTEFSIFGRVVAFCPRDEISSVVRMKPLEFSV